MLKLKNFNTYLFFFALFLTVVLNSASLFSQSIRLDEAQSIWVATKSVPELLRTTGQDVQTPLYLLILHFWTLFFGTDVIVTRLLSLAFFIATLPALYLLISETVDRDTALLGVVIFSFSPFILWYSQETRTYTLLTFLAALSHLFFLRYLRGPPERIPLGYILVSVAGIYSHYFFSFLILSQALYLFVFYRRRHFWTYLFSLVIIGISCLPWVVYVLHLGQLQNTEPLIPMPTSFNLLQIYINFLFGFPNNTVLSLAISFWPLLLMLLFVIFTRKMPIPLKPANYFVVMTFLPVFLVFAVSIIKPIFLPRYLIFVAPSLFTLIAWIIVNFTKNAIVSAPTLAILFFMALALNIQNRSASTPVKENYKGAVDYVNQQATAHDIVIVSSPFTVYPIEYYYNAPAKIVTLPFWDRYQFGPIPAFSQTAMITQAQSYNNVYDRIFLLTSYDQGYEGTIVHFFDTHYQRLFIHDFSAGVTLRIYKSNYNPPFKLTD